jgi:hypothetical protein
MDELIDELNNRKNQEVFVQQNLSLDNVSLYAQGFNYEFNDIKYFIRAEICYIVRWLTELQSLYMHQLDIEDIVLPAQ